jgi:hypothetical protein
MATVESAYLMIHLEVAERLEAAVPSAEDEVVLHAALNRVKALLPAAATFPTMKAAMVEHTFDITGTLSVNLADCPATQEDENHTGAKLLGHIFITGPDNIGNVILTGDVANGYDSFNGGEDFALPPYSAHAFWADAGLDAVASGERVLQFSGNLNDTFQWLAVFGTPAA